MPFRGNKFVDGWLFTGTAAAPIPNPNVGRILSTVNSSRQIQFGLKFIWLGMKPCGRTVAAAKTWD
jgi:hypothetical protein